MEMMSIKDMPRFVLYMRELLFAKEPQKVIIKMQHGMDMLKCPGELWVELSKEELSFLTQNHHILTEDKNGDVTRCLPPPLGYRDIMQPWITS